MKKNRIRLSESQLHRVIKESVRKVLREFNDPAEEEQYGYPEGYDQYSPFDRNTDWDTEDPIFVKIKKGIATEKEIIDAVREYYGSQSLGELLDCLYYYASPNMQKKADMEIDWLENDAKMFGHISRNNTDTVGNLGNGEPTLSDRANIIAAYHGQRWGKQKLPDKYRKSNHIDDINLNTYYSDGRNAMNALSDDEEVSNIGKATSSTIRQSFKNGQKFSKNKG